MKIVMYIFGLILGWGAVRAAYMTQKRLAMPRQQIGLALFDEAVRVWNGRGSCAIRDYTTTGIKQPMFPGSISEDGGDITGPGFKAGNGYSFNLAFRDELTGVLIQDIQDELDMHMLYPNQELDSENASCCEKMGDRDSPLLLVHRDTLWQPNAIQRSGHWHKYMANTLTSFSINSTTSISSVQDEILIMLTVRNRLARTLNLTIIPDHHGENRVVGKFVRELSDAIVNATSDAGPPTVAGWPVVIPAYGSTTICVALTFTKKQQQLADDSTRAIASHPSADPLAAFDPSVGKRFEVAQNATVDRLAWASEKLPQVHSSNEQFVSFYMRSILSVLQCRLDNTGVMNPNPFWELGNSVGETVSWDLSFSSALIAQLEPASLRSMLLRFFKNDILQHSWVSFDGTPLGFYIYGPFSALQIVRDYIAATGDIACLDLNVSKNETVIGQLKRVAIAMNHTYARTEDGLFDIGGGTGLALEIRTSGYEYVIAEITGLASDYSSTVAEWCQATGDHQGAALMFELAQGQARALQKLWNDDAGWYDNEYPDKTRHTVLSYKMFDLLRGKAVPLQHKARMVERIVDGEFLAPFGMFSISRSDEFHFDREDCDWGGGGVYVGQPGKIVQALFDLSANGENLGFLERAWNVLQGIVTWGQKLPYYPQTLYGDNLMLQPHERNWFLQLSAGAGAQAIISGVFGLRPSVFPLDTLSVSPSSNQRLLGMHANLTNYHFRGHVFDVLLDSEPGYFALRVDASIITQAAFGSSVQCVVHAEGSASCTSIETNYV